jgi:ubiquinone/menaquinone biosynthesis C-methylase UbiE
VKDATIVDIGGGASLLVDRLLQQGYVDVTVVDVSEAAMDQARARLAPRADEVTWIAADVRYLRLPRQVDVWHDRAVFHFLTEEADRQSYLSAVQRALRVGGHLVIATFGLKGPDRCSGLPVQRYDVDKLRGFFGPEFELVESLERCHMTPGGTSQEFTYAVFQRLR